MSAFNESNTDHPALEAAYIALLHAGYKPDWTKSGDLFVPGRHPHDGGPYSADHQVADIGHHAGPRCLARWCNSPEGVRIRARPW